VKVGSFAFLSCRAVGNPNPSLQWYSGGVPAESKNREFIFIPTDFPQNITYTCRAWNSVCVHHRSENITVIVQQ